ncbi:tetratricopeptide repeat protein [Flavicella marina]|uniref:tetratricopeptide repeat protein n=1 Tax=Flavicella marina TaxID=1475951 RepID=UPI001D01C5F6|nr:tetratricopeptide repeat protein [Flavicella marina]
MSSLLKHWKDTKATLQKYAWPIVGLKIIKIMLLIFFTFDGFSQSNESLFDQANELYRNEKYVEAIGLYEKIEASGKVSSELYYNLGNAYYKINKVAPSIYNLEKALLLNPQNKDAANNLIFANRMALDAIEELPKSFMQELEINIIQQLSYNQWAYLAVCFSIVSCLFFLFFYFSYIPSRKRAYFVVSCLTFIFLVTSVIFTLKQYDTSSSTIEAIVFDEKVSVKDAPLTSGQEVFEIHEGLKVFVLDEVDIWKKIKLKDGKTGWIKEDSLKIL